MRGRAPIQLLDTVRAVACARSGIDVLDEGLLSKDIADKLYKLHMQDVDLFVDECVTQVRNITDQLADNRDPSLAVLLAFISGLMVDRMTNKALITAPGIEKKFGYKRSIQGILVYDSNGEQKDLILYSGKVN